MPGRYVWKGRYTVLSVIVLGFLVASIDRIAMSVAIPYLAADLHLTPVEMGMVMSAFFASYSIAQVPGGILADRLGVRRVATVALVWWSGFTALTGLISNLTQLVATRFVFGLGEGVFPACAFKTVATWFPKRERATANSIMFAAGFLGSALAPLLVVAIIALWGWREVFLILAVPGIGMAYLFWRVIPDHPADKPGLAADELKEMLTDQEEESKNAPEGKETLRAILLNPLVIRYFLVIFTFDLTYWGFTTWLPTYLVKARGFSLVEMGVFASFPAFAGTIGCILAGWMSDRFFVQRRRMPIILSQMIAAVFLYFMFHATSTASLVIFQTLAGFFMMSFFGVFWALPMNSVRTRNMGVTGAFINMAGQFAAIVAPLVIGYLVQTANGGFGPTFVFLIGALFVSSAIVLSIPAPPRLQSSTRQQEQSLA